MRKLFLTSLALIVYTYLGYPLTVAVLARLRPRPLRVEAEFQPALSLIISAYNEAASITRKLRNCRELEYPKDRLEIIVVADGSSDETHRLAREVHGVRVLYQPVRLGKAAAMKRGAEAARGDVLVFSDANNLYQPDTLQNLVAPFADPTVGVATGRKMIEGGSGRSLDQAEGLYWKYESRLKEWESRVGCVTAVAGEVLAVRKSAFSPPPEGTVNDDFEIAMQAALHGWRIVYASDAISVEPASATLEDEARRRSRIVTGRWQSIRRLLPHIVGRPTLAWQVVSHKGLRPLVPFAMLGTAAGNAALLSREWWGTPLGALQAFFYGAALVGWRDHRKGRQRTIFYLPFYFCRVNVAALQGLWCFVGGGEHALWTRVRRADEASESP